LVYYIFLFVLWKRYISVNGH